MWLSFEIDMINGNMDIANIIVFRYLLSMLDLSKGKTGIFHLVSGVSVIRYALVVSVVNVVVNVVADIDVDVVVFSVSVAEVTSSLRGTKGNLGTLSLQAAG